jgi:hypothetical protein
MKPSSFPLVSHVLCIAFAGFAMPSPAHAGGNDGIKQLIDVTQLKAQAANEQALEGATKQKELLDVKVDVAAGLVVADVAAVGEFESTAGSDGLDDAEAKRLAELVAAAQQRVEGATADASTAIASAKKQLADTEVSGDKKRIKLLLKALRATVKAHRQTAAALRTLAKKLPINPSA